MKLIGDCNRCGLCCTDGEFVCRNLQIDTTLGAPYSTRCMAYDVRYDGMPILGRNAQGQTKTGVCRKDSAEETKIIVPWIGKGCSLKRKET